MKFNSKHDGYVYQLVLDGFAEEESGSVESPTGWFAKVDLTGEHDDTALATQIYGSPYVVLHQSNEGFVTVLGFENEAARDARYHELDQAYSLWDAGITEDEATEAIIGYRKAALWSSTDHDDTPLDSGGYSLSREAQRQMRDEVIEFIVSNVEHIRPYLETIGEGWGQVGADFWLTRNRHGAGFWDRGVAGPAVEALVESAHAYGAQSLMVDESGEVVIL